MARLILHSDDFGLHPAINQAILDCARAGTLSSASVLANGGAVREALAGAREVPALGLGVHLNIVRGRPISPPAQIPSLVDRNGRFFNSFPKLALRSKLGLLRVEDIHTEYRNQVLLLEKLGLEPSHFDSEKHSHLLLFQAGEALQRITEEFGLLKTRRVNESPLGGSDSLKVRLLEYSARRGRLDWKRLTVPDYSFGIALTGCPHPETAAREMERLLAMDGGGNTVIEWIFHVGYETDYSALSGEYGPFSLTAARQQETEFLLSARTRSILDRHRDQIISFRGL